MFREAWAPNRPSADKAGLTGSVADGLASHIHHVVWKVGRLFGFQAFNESAEVYATGQNRHPSSQSASEPKAATILLAADHIVGLLNASYARLAEAQSQGHEVQAKKLGKKKAPMPSLEPGKSPVLQSELLFHQAVLQLHVDVFENYISNWCPLVHLAPLPRSIQDMLAAHPAASWGATHNLLSQLALYMLLWVEGANLRHTSEVLCFLFWTMVHTPAMAEHCAAVLEPVHDTLGHSNAWRLALRSTFGPEIRQAREALGLGGHDARVHLLPQAAAATDAAVYQEVTHSLAQAVRTSLEAKPGVVARVGEFAASQAGAFPASLQLRQASHTELLGPWPRAADGGTVSEATVWEALLDLAVHGDGGWVVDRLVAPIFTVLAYEMDVLALEHPCHRVGYCDANESLCHQDIVHACLGKLGITRQVIKSGDLNDVYRVLTVELSGPRGAALAAPVKKGDKAPGTDNHNQALQLMAAEVAAEPGLHQAWDAGLIEPAFKGAYASAFWSAHVFTKTFVEARSWWTVLKVFWRVWALNLLGLQLMTAIAFEGWDPLAISSLAPAHAVLVALERLARALTARHPGLSAMQARVKQELQARGPPQDPNAAPDLMEVRLRRRTIRLENAPLLALFGWLEYAIIAGALCLLFGYRVNANPEILKLSSPLLFTSDLWLLIAVAYAAVYAVHWVLTTRDGYTISLLSALRFPSALAGAYSVRPRPHHHIAGSLAIGWRVTVIQYIAMALVIALKLTFEYFAISRPMVEPVRALLRQCWPCLYSWKDVRLAWFLVVLRALPSVLMCQVDGLMSYQALLSLWTLARGYLNQDLVTLHGWSNGEVARDFNTAPARWWAKCMSVRAQHAQIKQQKGTTSPAGNGLITSASLDMGAAPGSPGVTSALSDNSDTAAGSNHPTGQGSGDGADGATEEVLLNCAQWRAFVSAWGALVGDLRDADLLSDAEAQNLALHDTTVAAAWLEHGMLTRHPAGSLPPDYLASVHILVGGEGEPGGILGPVLLPGLMHVGVVRSLIEGIGRGKNYLSTAATLWQLRGAGLAVLAGLGFITPQQTLDLCRLGEGWVPIPLVTEHQEARQALLAAFQRVAQLLASACLDEDEEDDASGSDSDAPASAVVDRIKGSTAHASLVQPLITALKAVLKGLEVECRAARRLQATAPAASKSAAERGKSRAQAAQNAATATAPGPAAEADLRQQRDGADSEDIDLDFEVQLPLLDLHVAVLEGVQQRLADMTQEEVLQCLDQLRTTSATAFQEIPGFERTVTGSGITHTASAERPALQLVRYLQLLLCTAPSEAQPRSTDARRALTSFLNSLAMSSLQQAPSLALCPALVTLTPLYHEDVVFALEARKLAETITVQGKGRGQSSSGVSRATSLRARRLMGSNMGDRKAGEMTSFQQAAVSKANQALATELKMEMTLQAAGLTDLLTEGSAADGEPGSVSLITYLLSIYGHEFNNFKERIARTAGLHAAAARRIVPKDFASGGMLEAHALELQLWASYRAQLLARTVRGMECYHRALQVLASLEHPKSAAAGAPWLRRLVDSKFQHLVSAQAYGSQRKSQQLKDLWAAQGIEELLRRHPALAVSYLDTAGAGKPSYAVLLKGLSDGTDDKEKHIEEVYRVRLPTNPFSARSVIIGEGKPENQNMASMFCIGEALQTIDMNQDNTVSEALKLVNVLTELGVHDVRPQLTALHSRGGDWGTALTSQQALVMLRRAKAAVRPTAIVGIREWIFSNRVGALGSFAAATEYAFSSVTQRAMAAGRVRLHYGHPDFFNRLHIMTRSGTSKATRSLHVSEDIFAGLNHMARGARIKQCEYSSVGKGRDMGLASIMGFEQKIATGNAQVFLSRDLARLAARLDMGRLCNFYYSGLGFFPLSMFTMYLVVAHVVTTVALALVRVGKLPGEGTKIILVLDGAPLAVVTGLVANVPWMAQSLLDHGLLQTLLTNARMLVSGSTMFFAFRLHTTSAYFMSGLMYGGASYISTGRGFAYRPTSFNHLYSLYGRTHLVPGVELVTLLIAIGVLLSNQDYTVSAYAFLTWPMWIYSISLVITPFWFNPESFSWAKVRADWRSWKMWQLAGEADSTVGSTWDIWNRKELERARNWHGRQVGMWGVRLQAMLLDVLPPAVLAGLAVIQLLRLTRTGELLVASLLIWVVMAFLGSFRALIARTGNERLMWQWRALMEAAFIAMFAGYLTAVAIYKGGYGGMPLVLIIILHTGVLVALHRTALHLLPPLPFARVVDGGFWATDTLVGFILLCMVSVMSVGGALGQLQAVLLFGSKYSWLVREGRLARTMQANVGLGAASGSAQDPTSRSVAIQRRLDDAVEAVERSAPSFARGKSLAGPLKSVMSRGMSVVALTTNAITSPMKANRDHQHQGPPAASSGGSIIKGGWRMSPLKAAARVNMLTSSPLRAPTSIHMRLIEAGGSLDLNRLGGGVSPTGGAAQRGAVTFADPKQAAQQQPARLGLPPSGNSGEHHSGPHKPAARPPFIPPGPPGVGVPGPNAIMPLPAVSRISLSGMAGDLPASPPAPGGDRPSASGLRAMRRTLSGGGGRVQPVSPAGAPRTSYSGAAPAPASPSLGAPRTSNNGASPAPASPPVAAPRTSNNGASPVATSPPTGPPRTSTSGAVPGVAAPPGLPPRIARTSWDGKQRR